MFWNTIRDTVVRALQEDVGTGDLTTESLVPAEAITTGYIYAKEPGVVAGLPVAQMVFDLVDPSLEFRARVEDGAKVEAGTVLAEIYGSARGILIGERLALNFLQRLSGVATKTAQYVDLLTYYNARIVDTRKTTPGLRALEKYAVRMGGGSNHRFGLFDGILIKDNHIKMAGGIQQAISAARQRAPHTIKIEVEVEDLDGLQAALEARADIIMLDNMSLDTMREAVRMTEGKALLEASGGITHERLVEVAKTGVDLISIGALTHSIQSMDISLDVVEIKGQNGGEQGEQS